MKIIFTFFIFQLLSFQVLASSLSMLFHTGTEGHVVKAFHHGVAGQCKKVESIYSCDQIKIDIHALSSKEKVFLAQIQKVLNYPSESYIEILDVKVKGGYIISGLLKIGKNSYSISDGEYFPEEGSLVLSFRMKLSKIGVLSPLNFQNKIVSDEVSWIVTVPYKKQ
jgi:hypothetical protein